jgi:hypothetical protein
MADCTLNKHMQRKGRNIEGTSSAALAFQRSIKHLILINTN